MYRKLTPDYGNRSAEPEILGDIVLRPAFDPLEMAKEKKVIFEEMGMVEDTPDDLVMEMFTEGFWPGHPLGRPILGTTDGLLPDGALVVQTRYGDRVAVYSGEIFEY